MTGGDVLAPLAARHAHWLNLTAAEVAADRQEAAVDVRAMQLVLRMERDRPPLWSEALAAASIAATAVCLDQRSAEGGDWHGAVGEYVAAHIRKVTRRARAGQWEAIAELPGITVRLGAAEVRALVPGPVDNLDKRIAKLQVGGTDVPVDLAAAGSDADTGDPAAAPGSLILNVPEHVGMTTGKLMAQTGHAGMITAALLAARDRTALDRWWAAGLPTVVRRRTEPDWESLLVAVRLDAEWARRLVAVRDAGFTEIAPGTVTVIGDARLI